MSANKNLHSKTVLTEFARDFEDESSETVISKLVNKIYEACNNVNADIGTSSGTQQQQPQNEDEATNSESGSITSVPSNSDQSTKEQAPMVYQVDASQGRTPLNVIKRISNLVALREKDLNDYKNTELQKLWMPDDKSRECYDCALKFTTFRRKHHCKLHNITFGYCLLLTIYLLCIPFTGRLCGQIFCSKCCNQIIPGKIIKCSGYHRVCTYCSKVVLSYIKSPDINADLKSDLQALEEDLSNKFVGTSSNSNQSSSTETSPHHRKISVGYQEERLVTNTSALSNADRKTILQQSNTLKSLYEDMITSLSNSQQKGIDLMNFLIANKKSTNKQQAIAVLSAMIEAGFIVPFLNYENSSTIESTDGFHVEFNENLFYNLQRLDVTEEPIRNEIISMTDSTNDESFLDDIVPPSIYMNENMYSNAKENELQNSILSTVGSKPLLEAYCEHEELLIQQLLRNENLDQSWSKVLIPQCARIAHNIHPEFNRTLDSMDVRNFVNIKKISGGNRSECNIVGGVVFSKNVAHKDMKTKIDNPKVLLLACPIVYQRVEGKFVTIESLILQEKEYLRNVTSRILSLEPDVVLVHKNVAGIAQDLLRDNGITLVLDVKLSVFDRLARCMQCDIVTSIDSNVGDKPKLGTCKRFYVKNFTEADGSSKSIMFFEIPFSQRGCSLLLRGGTGEELSKLKKVSSFVLFSRYNWRLELSFLLDSFAQPPLKKSSIFDSIDQSPSEQKALQHSISEVSDNSKNEVPKKEVTIENVADFSDPLRVDPLTFETTVGAASLVQLKVQDSFDNKFRTYLASTILSVSPFINFPLPFFETDAGRKCALRQYFPGELFYSHQWAGKNEKVEKPEIVPTPNIEEKELNVNPPHAFLTMKITKPADDKDIQTAIADYRRSGFTYPKVLRMKIIEKKSESSKAVTRQKSNLDSTKDAFDIYNHQRLPVLFCSFYLNSNKELPTSFCAQPLLLDMHFYGQDDIMLGLFLERYCFRSSYICQSCKLPMMDHVRRYAHSMGVVQVKLDKDPNRTENSNILMTSRCTICNTMTQSVTMSSDTWCLSFAKFLELKFHGNCYTRRNIEEDANTNQLKSNQPACPHSLFHDHIQYFANNGVIVSFMYSPVEIWEIKLPQLALPLKASSLINKKEYAEKIKQFSVRGYDVYAKIHEKLANLSTEVKTPMLEDLKKGLHRDRLLFKGRIDIVHMLMSSDEVYQYEMNDALYMMHKELADSIELWGPRLNEAASQLKSAQKNEPSTQLASEVPEDFDDLNFSQSCDDLEYESDIMTRSIDELQNDKKVDKKRIRKLLSTILPSSSEQNALQTPFTVNEHYCLPTGQFPILVHDQDLSSIISYSLMSYDYKKILENVINPNETSGGSPSLKRKNPSDSSLETEEKECTSDKNSNKKNSNSHIEIQFQDSNTQFTCKSYFAKEFDDLRNKCLLVHDKPQTPDESAKIDAIRRNYARSLSQSNQWEARGGKSGSKFSKTSDDRFILKEMSKQDVGEFEKFAPNYFEYVNACIQKNLPTLLAKIFGIYKVVIKKKESLTEKAVLVIENLFCDINIANKYDLKGSERNRLVDPTSQIGETVLLDENLIKCE